MRVSEIFYSLQGEGGRAGEPSVFVRLSGCSAKYACMASGVVCDTEFESGTEMSPLELSMELAKAVKRVVPEATFTDGPLPWIVWTGGEPLDQLTPEHIEGLREVGWTRHALETSGTKAMSLEVARSLDWITISPKVAEHILAKHFPWAVNGPDGVQVIPVSELRYVRHAGQPGVPEPKLAAQHYYLSPHSDGFTINKANVQHCVNLCLQNPRWKMSVQQHKVWAVL